MHSEYLLSRWENVRTGLLQTLDKFRDHDLDFQPYPASRPVKHIMLHIAHEEYSEFAYGVVQTLNDFPPEYTLQDYPDLQAIKSLLETVHAQTLEYLTMLDDHDLNKVIHTPWGATYRLIEMLDHMIEHEVHHRGELSLILGLLGREGFNA